MEKLVETVNAGLDKTVETVNAGLDKGAKAIGSVIDDFQYGQPQEAQLGNQLVDRLNQGLANFTRQQTYTSLLTLQNPVFREFTLCSSLLALKMVGLSAVATYREEVQPDRRVLDTLVDRVRSALKTDVENNLVFCMLGLAYVSTNPDLVEATNLFRLVTFLSLTHSGAWVGRDKVARKICWLGRLGVNLYMGSRVLQNLCEVL
eukprot:GFUD01010230.1.p1 GENE.GFUD01010230.1~~GFUD01010230.1.p1  ORF type:complete len:204 (-),score=86.79 GFUD01010230.1:92-703(-)